MIKAVFFDLYHTLVRYEPSREELTAGFLKEFGIEVSADALRRPLVAADEFIYREMSRLPLGRRSDEERAALFLEHQAIVLREAGIAADTRIAAGLLGKMQRVKMDLVLFDDVAPALTDLKGRGLWLGLISNIDQDIGAMLEGLGLPSWLDSVVTSRDAGASKPRPEIFLEAVRRAGVAPAEAVYVGDQYEVDILGAAGAGLKGILLDRGGYFAEISDCPRIRSLSEIVGHL